MSPTTDLVVLVVPDMRNIQTRRRHTLSALHDSAAWFNIVDPSIFEVIGLFRIVWTEGRWSWM